MLGPLDPAQQPFWAHLSWMYDINHKSMFCYLYRPYKHSGVLLLSRLLAFPHRCLVGFRRRRVRARFGSVSNPRHTSAHVTSYINERKICVGSPKEETMRVDMGLCHMPINHKTSANRNPPNLLSLTLSPFVTYFTYGAVHSSAEQLVLEYRYVRVQICSVVGIDTCIAGAVCSSYGWKVSSYLVTALRTSSTNPLHCAHYGASRYILAD